MGLGAFLVTCFLVHLIKSGKICNLNLRDCEANAGCCRSARDSIRYHCSHCMDFFRNSRQNNSTAEGSTQARPPSRNHQHEVDIDVNDPNKPPSYESIANCTTMNNAGTLATARSGLPAPPSYESVINSDTTENHYHM